MKNLIIVTFAFFFLNSLSAQERKSNLELLDSIIAAAKLQSVNTKYVDWETVTPKVRASLDLQDTTRKALIKPAQLLLEELKDFHGGLFINNQRYATTYQSEENHIYELDIPLMQQIYQKTQQSIEIDIDMLTPKIGYINIPIIGPYGEEQTNKYTNLIRDKLCELLSKKPNKLVIDLRTNMGGNLYPMLSGLGLILPNIKLGGDTKDGTYFYQEWEIVNGNFYQAGYPRTSLPLNCKSKSKIKKIVVLTSRYTGSSGEAVASSLKGQKSITLIGETTGGASSTTGWSIIEEGVIFSPTVSYYMSIDKTFHKNGVKPDIEIEEKLNLDDLKKGETIEKAIEILR